MMDKMDLMRARFLPFPDVVENNVGEEIVLLHLTNGVYFGVDAIGAVIWQRLKNGENANDILAALSLEFDVASEVLESDMCTFLSDLVANDLVTIHSLEQ